MDTLIVGDVNLYTKGLAQILRSQPSVSVIGTASDFDSALCVFARLTPHIVLLDMAMPRAFEAARRIHAVSPETRIIALSVSEDRREICTCAEAGVDAIVMRDASVDDLLDVMNSASNGEFYCSPRTAAFLLEHVASLARRCDGLADIPTLTRRQTHILDLLTCGFSNKEIALRLGIEVATVKNHVHQILQRLQVNRRGEAAAVWLQQRSTMTRYFPAKEFDDHFSRGLSSRQKLRERETRADSDAP